MAVARVHGSEMSDLSTVGAEREKRVHVGSESGGLRTPSWSLSFAMPNSTDIAPRLGQREGDLLPMRRSWSIRLVRRICTKQDVESSLPRVTRPRREAFPAESSPRRSGGSPAPSHQPGFESILFVEFHSENVASSSSVAKRTLPGLSNASGSSMRLTSRIMASVPAPSSRRRNFRFVTPIPCSPAHVPSREMASFESLEARAVTAAGIAVAPGAGTAARKVASGTAAPDWME